jgi:hypothetical protein
MRRLRPGHQEVTEETSGIGMALNFPLMCLSHITDASEENSKDPAVFWKPAIDAGIVPVIVDLLALPDRKTILSLLRLSGTVLLAGPRGEGQRWAGQLPRAIAGLIIGKPPVAVHEAVAMLFNIALRRDLALDLRAWGVYETVRRLESDSNPDTARGAKGLLFMVDHGLNVRPAPSLRNLSLTSFKASYLCCLRCVQGVRLHPLLLCVVTLCGGRRSVKGLKHSSACVEWNVDFC